MFILEFPGYTLAGSYPGNSFYKFHFMPNNQGNTSLLVNALFMFLGKYLKGYRTLILSVCAILVGSWEWITGSGLFAFLCSISDTVKFLAVTCNITESNFYAVVLLIVGFLTAVMRKLTDTPIGETGTSALSVDKVSPFAIILAAVVFFILVFIGLPLLLTTLRNVVA